MEYTDKRFRELAERSYQTGQYIFTDFLGQAEQDELLRLSRELSYAGVKLFGGYEGSERNMARFGREEDLGYAQDFPITCILIEPRGEKFATEYSHRDYLGALMNLGMERRVFGDILVSGKCAYLFAASSAVPFITENLISVGHNHVQCAPAELPAGYLEKRRKEILIQCASPRADAVISKVFNLSRGAVLELFKQQKVIVNGRTCENNDRQLSAGDIISARGFGKFEVGEAAGFSRRGKLNLKVRLYQ